MTDRDALRILICALLALAVVVIVTGLYGIQARACAKRHPAHLTSYSLINGCEVLTDPTLNQRPEP